MADFSRKRAVVIGVDEYQHITPLKYCGSDAREVASAFRDSLEFKEEDILVLTTDSPHKPNRNDIIREVGTFLQQDIKDDELLVFYFSGHGMRDPRSKRDYLLPLDASLVDAKEEGLSVEYLVDKLSDTGCKNIVMFIDACREDFDEGGKAVGTSGVGEFSRGAVDREGLVTFFSCDPKEKSYEIEELGHGSFTYCLLEAIKKGDCATVALIDKFLGNEVPRVNKRYGKTLQRPFTVIKPQEKSELKLFYNVLAARASNRKYEDLITVLADFFARKSLEVKLFDEAVVLIDRARDPDVSLSADELARFNFLEALAEKRLSPTSIKAAWEAFDRLQVKPSDPPKDLS